MGLISDIDSIAEVQIISGKDEKRKRFIAVCMYDGNLKIYDHPAKKGKSISNKIYDGSCKVFGSSSYLGMIKNGSGIFWSFDSS